MIEPVSMPRSMKWIVTPTFSGSPLYRAQKIGSALRYSGVIPVWILIAPFGASVNTSGFSTDVPHTASTSGAWARINCRQSASLTFVTTSVGTWREYATGAPAGKKLARVALESESDRMRERSWLNSSLLNVRARP